MKLSTKKTIAREFILVMILSCLTGIGFLLTYPYNAYLNSKINEHETEITSINKLADSLSKSYTEKTFEDKGDYISRVYLALKDIGYKNMTTENSLRKSILNDSILRKDIYASLKDNIDGFTKSKLQFDIALRNQLTKEDIENKNKAKILETKMEGLKEAKELANQKKLDYEEQINFTSNLLIVLVLLFYIFRPLIYLFKWSLTTLRKTE